MINLLSKGLRHRPLGCKTTWFDPASLIRSLSSPAALSYPLPTDASPDVRATGEEPTLFVFVKMLHRRTGNRRRIGVELTDFHARHNCWLANPRTAPRLVAVIRSLTPGDLVSVTADHQAPEAVLRDLWLCGRAAKAREEAGDRAK